MMTGGGGMSTTAIGATAEWPVTARGVVTPSGVWALVVPGVRVIAPFVDVGDVQRCALDLRLRPDEYVALPFTGLGRIVLL
ncbi:conserved hypothetical protein [Frankia sp. Hr75.2]|nr:conserved hypothetical protein [Frankia sp. Hr75.2]